MKNLKTGEVTERQTDGFFLGIGHTPNTAFLDGQIDLDDHKFIKTVNGTTETNVPGIFACGDVQDSYYRQAISAAGTGCMAAIRAERFFIRITKHKARESSFFDNLFQFQKNIFMS